MSKISDIIESFILEQLDDSGYVFLSRNELANFFKDGLKLIPSVNWISKYDFKSFIERLVFLDIFSIVSFISSSTYRGCFLSKTIKNKIEDKEKKLWIETFGYRSH